MNHSKRGIANAQKLKAVSSNLNARTPKSKLQSKAITVSGSQQSSH